MVPTTARASAPRPVSPRVQWVICIIAAIGFAFDTYALLVLPLIVRSGVEGTGDI